MDALVEFLREQIDTDETMATAASPGPWKPNAEQDEVLAADDITVAEGFALSGNQLRATVLHIARWDPKRALDEVDAKRRILRAWEEASRNPYEGMTDDELHERRAHSAYEYCTTEGQRKAWYDADTPPAGEGWELNITSANPDAFERFDYHEERYWRRLDPRGPREWKPVVPLHIKLLALPYADRPGYREEWRP